MSDLVPAFVFVIIVWVVSQAVLAADGGWVTAAIVAWVGIGIILFAASLVAAFLAGASDD